MFKSFSFSPKALAKSMKFSTEIGKEGSIMQANVLIGLGLDLCSEESFLKDFSIFLFNNLLCSD
jgi:hypothetical protein